MSLELALQTGLDAYGRGDFESASRSWREAASAPEGPATTLLRSLATIADAVAAGAPIPELAELELLPRHVLGLDVSDLRRQLDIGVQIPILRPAKRLSRRALLRFVFFTLLMLAGFVALRWTPLAELATKDRMVAALEGLRGAWWSPLALMGLYLVLSPLGVPATPLMAAGGVVFGVAGGSVVNYLGALLGAASSYWVARSLGRELVEHYVGDALRKVEHLVERHGFWPLARLRFLPVPFALFNFGCALTGIRFPLFIGSSAVGLAPIIVIWTYFWASMIQAAAGESTGVYRNLFLAMAAVFMLTFLPRILRGVWRRKRLREIRKQRNRRDSASA